MKEAKFRSCFIVDVSVNTDSIVLTDSSLHTYHIDMKSKTVVDEFKLWFANVFSKGIGNIATVFQYEVIDISECESEMTIVKFITKNIS